MKNIWTILEKLVPAHDFTEVPPSDIVQFLKELSETGLPTEMSDFHTGGYFMSRFIDRWESITEDSTPGQREYPTKVFDHVGLSIKLIYAWESLTRGLFSAKNTTPEIILESANDLWCSAFLSSDGFSKQALQMLRNYCEECVAILYFRLNKAEYQSWLADYRSYHFPDFRTMVGFLKDRGHLTADENGFLHNQYTSLNSSVHSRRHRLNMGFARMSRNLANMGLDDNDDWANEVEKLIRFMLALYGRLSENGFWAR